MSEPNAQTSQLDLDIASYEPCFCTAAAATNSLCSKVSCLRMKRSLAMELPAEFRDTTELSKNGLIESIGSWLYYVGVKVGSLLDEFNEKRLIFRDLIDSVEST